jgi:hypothetical protein
MGHVIHLSQRIVEDGGRYPVASSDDYAVQRLLDELSGRVAEAMSMVQLLNHSVAALRTCLDIVDQLISTIEQPQARVKLWSQSRLTREALLMASGMLDRATIPD